MINAVEIFDNIFIGSMHDYELNKKELKDYKVICCAKHPYFKKSDDIDFYYDKNVLYLNLIDADKIEYINKKAIQEAINYYIKNINNKFFIFCNQGLSRSPTIALILLILIGDKRINISSIDQIMYSFRKIYPEYNPNIGMKEYLVEFYTRINKND